MDPLLPLALALAAALAVAPTAAPAVDAPAPGSTAPTPVGVWPLVPRPPVVRGFDPPQGPYGAGHRGVDLAGAPGQPVHTSLAGTVAFVGTIAGTPIVVVEHGGTRTTYQPVAASVATGAAVGRDAVLGTLALAGSHCLPAACLHWGWIRDADDVYLDPLLLVGAGPMRLLPLTSVSPS